MTRTWTIGLFTILLTFLLVGYNIQLQKKIILQEAHRNTSTLVNEVELDIERSMSDLEQVFLDLENYLASPANKKEIDPPAIRNFIDNLVLENPYLSGLTILDNNGQILHWNNNLQKLNLSQRQYFRIHQSGDFEGLYVGLPKASILNQGQWIFGSSKAIRNTDHSLSMVLTAIIDLNYFYRQYHSMFTAPGIRLTITSPAGHIYTSIPGQEELVGKQLPELIATKNTMFDNEHELTMGKKVANYPLIVRVTREKSTVLVPWRSTVLSFVALGVAIILLLFFLTYHTDLYMRRRLKKKEAHSKTITDPLTKLYNRPHILELVKLEIKKASRTDSPLSVIMLDLDHFKDVNNNYGHQKGDEVLEGTAAILRQCCRETDIISRFGGEKFLLVLPDTDLKGAISDARKICKTLAQKDFSHTSGEFNVTASFGVAQWSSDEADITEALKRADAALHSVKNCGRDNVRWMLSKAGHGGINDIVCWLNTENK